MRDTEMMQWMSRSPSWLPPSQTLPRLRPRGQFLEQETGTSWSSRQTTAFNLFGRYANKEDIRPFLLDRQGFNDLRVWTLYDIPLIGRCTLDDHPDLYSMIPSFLQLCGNYGYYVELTAYTGINDKAHWGNLITASQASSNARLELVNEWDVNRNKFDDQGRLFRLNDYSRPDNILASHGSNGSQSLPVPEHWGYAVMHYNDAPEYWRKVGHNSMEVWGGPTLANENTRFTDHDQSPAHAYDSAAGAALLCGGACYHTVTGKYAGLFTPEEKAIAQQWLAGAMSVDVACQPGRYNHAIELEGPDDLRVYQRILADGQTFTVHIRK